METPKSELVRITSSEEVLLVRQLARSRAKQIGFSLVDQTKFVTAVSELARNTVDYGGGGTVSIESLNNGERRGLRVSFEDQGPGIADVELALKDGYTTGKGLGLGLGGAKRLVSEFEIISHPGKGTRITIVKWI